MDAKRRGWKRWMKWALLTVVVVAAGAGLWAYFAFAWIFFVKPGDGGPNLALAITHVAGASATGDRDGAPGFADGVGEAARLNKPIRLALATDGSIIFADIKNHAIRRLDAEGRVTTLAGGPDKKGHKDGPAREAMLNSPHGVAVRGDGVIAVAEAGNNDIRLLTPTSTPSSNDGAITYAVTTLAGSATEKGMRDGPAAEALFNAPHAVAWGTAGELYIADIGNARLRMIQDGVCTTIAGTGRRGATDGDLNTGTLNFPMDFALAVDGSLWIADAGSLTIRRWSREAGLTTPFPGRQLAMPHGITIGPDGAVIVAELNGQRVLAFDPATGAVRTLCGTMEKGIGEGRLNRPAAVLAVDRVVWIADLGNHRIAKVTLE